MDARAQDSFLSSRPEQSLAEGQTAEEQALRAPDNVLQRINSSGLNEVEPGLPPQSAELSQPQSSSESKESESTSEPPLKVEPMVLHSAELKSQSPSDEDSAWEMPEKPKTMNELESELSALKVNYEQLLLEHDILSKSNSSNKKQIEDLHAELTQSEARLTSAQAQHDAYIKEQMQKTLQQVDKGLEAQQEASKKLDELEQKFKVSFAAEREAFATMIASLQSQLQYSQSALQEEKENSKRLEHLVNLAGQQRDSDSLQIANLSAQSHQADIALQAEKERTEQLRNKAHQQEEADKLQIAQLETELHQAKSSLQTEMEQADHLLNASDERIRSNEAKIIDLELKLQRVEVILNPAKEKAEQALAEAREQIKKDTFKIKNLAFQVQQLEMTSHVEHSKLQGLLDEAYEQIADNGMQIENLKANLEQAELALKTEKETLKAEKDASKAQTSQASQQIAALQAQLESLTAQVIHLGQFSQKVIRENEQSKHENEKLKAELALRKDAEFANRSLFEKQKEKEALLQEKISSLQNRLSLITADRDLAEEGLIQHIFVEQGLKAEIRTLQDKLQMNTPPENKKRELKEGAPQYFEEKSHRERDSKSSIDQKPEMKTTPSKEKRSYADVVKDINESDQEKLNAPYKGMRPLMNSIFNPRRPSVKVPTVKVVNNPNPAPLKPRSMG
jgi:hypothetical protein